MARTKPIGGYGDVRFNDRTLLFKGEMTWGFQVFSKKGVVGRDGRHHGHVVEPKVSFIKGKFTYDGGVTIRELEAVTDATVSVTLADGRQLVLRGAYVAGDIVPGGDEAEVELTWEGEAGEELAAQGA